MGFFVLMVVFGLPFAAHAAEGDGWPGFVPKCGGKSPSVPAAEGGGATTVTYTPCSTCDLAELVKNVLDFVWKYVALAGVALMLMIGGFQMVAGGLGGSATAYQKGLGTVKNAFIGLTIVLVSWLAIDTVIKFLAKQSLTSGTPAELPQTTNLATDDLNAITVIKLGPWNKLKCTKLNPVPVTTRPRPPPSSTSVGGQASGGQASGGNGAACTQVTQGSCSVASLQSTFGTAATAASTICQAESGGVDSAESRVDILPRSGNRPFSIGLFQINLTANTFSCDGQTLNCPSAFTGRNRDAIIRDETLYAQCRMAAKNAFCNVQKAKDLYDGRGGRWNDWLGTARNCRLPL